MTNEEQKITQNGGPENGLYPATRRLKKFLPRGARFLVKIFKRLPPKAVVVFSSQYLKLTHDRKACVLIGGDESGYALVDNGVVHRFSTASRLWTVMRGYRARGLRLGNEYVLDRITFSDGDVVIDVGANTGDLALYFVAIGVKVTYFAIEPSPREFQCLTSNLKENSAVSGCHPFNVAVWNENVEGMSFFVKSDKADSSLFPVQGATQNIPVPVRRLDSFDELRELDVIKLIKVECEGAEPEALAGAEAILSRVEYISVDVGFERGTDKEATLPAVANFLISRGFECVGFEGSRYVLLFMNQRLCKQP